MKKRKTFVSNSSTSSFVLAYRPSKKCRHCGCKHQSPEEVLEYYKALTGMEYDEDYPIVTGAMRIKKELSTYECAYNKVHILDIVTGIDDAIKEGMTVVMLTIPRDNNELRDKLTQASDRVIGNVE